MRVRVPVHTGAEPEHLAKLGGVLGEGEVGSQQLGGVLGEGEGRGGGGDGGGEQRVRSRAEAASLAFARLGPG